MNDFFLEFGRKLPDFFNNGRFHCYLCIFFGRGYPARMHFAISGKSVFDLSKRPDIHKTARYRGCRCHLWTDKVRASAFALSAFKIPV